jgi:RNA polymerase sigma-70 factor (ECF subfamily)
MIKSQEDLYLIALIREGDSKALERLFRKYYNSLCRFSSFLVQRDDLAEEIVADVFFKLWEKRESLLIESNLRAYLFKATRHTTINYIKQERNLMDDLSEELPEESYNPADELIFKELEHGMHELIDNLPEKRKAIFQLNRFEGFTYGQIAEILSLSAKTVENQMGKAIKQLRTLYKTQQL